VVTWKLLSGKKQHTQRCKAVHTAVNMATAAKLQYGLTLMLLVGQQEGHLAWKKQGWVAGIVICLEQGAHLHMAHTCDVTDNCYCHSVSCFSKTQTPRKRAIKWVCVCNLNVNNVNDKRNHPLVNTKSSRLTIVFFSSSASRHDVCVLNPVTVTIVTQIVLDLKVITAHKSIHFCIRNNVRTDTILTIHSNQKKIFAGYVIQKLFKISFRIEQTC